RGEESSFAVGIARHLGMTEAERLALFDLDASPKSSFSRSLESASVWCTDWNAFDTFQAREIFADSYHAPLEIRSRTLSANPPYPNTKSHVGVRGCTPGAPAPLGLTAPRNRY